MTALVIVYPAAGFFHTYLPYEVKNRHERQKERKTRQGKGHSARSKMKLDVLDLALLEENLGAVERRAKAASEDRLLVQRFASSVPRLLEHVLLQRLRPGYQA